MKQPIIYFVGLLTCLTFGRACFGRDAVGADDKAGARTVYSANYRCTVSLPAGWIQIPQDQVQERHAEAAAIFSKSSQPLWDFDMAFQRDGQANWFAYPCVILEAKPYPNGLQPDDATIAQDVKEMSGRDFKSLRDKMNPQAFERFSTGGLGQPQWDDNTKTVVVPLQFDVAGIGKVKGVMAGRFGRSAFVAMFCYATDTGFASQMGDCQKIIDSFQFDPGALWSADAAQAQPGIFHGCGTAAAGSVLAALMYTMIGASRFSKNRGRNAAASDTKSSNCSA